MKTDPNWKLKRVTTVKCPVCATAMYPTRKYTLEYRWLQCNDCGHWLLAIPDAEADRLQTEGVSKDTTRAYAVTHSWRRQLWLRSYESKFRSVLDVGCGTGAFLLCFPEAEARVGVSMDVATQSPSDDIAHISADFSDLELTQTFDLVTAWHVVEHAIHPREFIEKLLARCNPGGLLAIEIPLDRHLSLPGTYDGHPHRFTAESWARMLRPFLEQVECLYLSLGFCQAASLILARNVRPSKTMKWDQILDGCHQGGKRVWPQYFDKTIGKYCALFPPKELVEAGKAGLRPGWVLVPVSHRYFIRIEGMA